MKKIFMAVLIAAVAGTVYFVPEKAEAIPAFARKFQVGCEMCHRAFPELNEFGEKFKEQGYQMQIGDGGEIEKAELGEKLTLEKGIFPLSIRIVGDFKTKEQSGSTPDTKSRTSIAIPQEVVLLTAGTLFKNISYFGEIEWEFEDGETKTGVEMGYIAFNNITGDNSLNIRTGLIAINEWGLPGHRGVLQKKRNVHSTAVADDSWDMMKAEQAIELYGRPMDGPVFYNLGLSNGRKGFNAEDNNSAKNIFGRLGFNHGGQEVGILGYFGKNAVSGTDAQNNFNRVGFDYILRCKDLEVYGQYFLGQDKNPTFSSNPVKKNSRGYFINANYRINPMLLAVLQYDYTKIRGNVTSTSARAGREAFLTPGIAYYPIQNLRTVLEYQFDLVKRDNDHTLKQNRFNIRLDFAF